MKFNLVMDQGKKSVFEIVNFMSIVSMVLCMDETPPVSIERQLRNDSIYLSSGYNFTCVADGNDTYLVDERRCVNSQELLNDCMFAISPNGSQNYHMIAVYVERHQNNTIILMTADVNSSVSLAVITHRQQYVEVNSSCRIDSLEVYRGRKKVTEISHDGFAINDDGNIEVDQALILSRYSFDEFKGELYRMNMTCLVHEDQERGCLFFKVIGKSNITRAKFGGTVSGTIQTPDTYMDKMDEPTPRITTIDIITYSISAVAVFLILFFIVVLICTVCHCCCTKTKAHRKSPRENQTTTAIPSRLKWELDVSYLISAAHDIEETSSSGRPSLSGQKS